MSYFTPCTPVSCAIGRLRLKVPMVRPSGFATLYMWFAAMMLLPPGMFCTITVGLPGHVLRQVARQHARRGVVAAARLVADDDGDGLACEVDCAAAASGSERAASERRHASQLH